MTPKTINYCGQLLLESIFKYYKNKEYGLSYLGKLSGKFGKGYTLTLGLALAALKKGMKVRYITKSNDFDISKDVDYEKFYGKEGVKVIIRAKRIFEEAKKIGLISEFRKFTLKELRRQIDLNRLPILLIDYAEIHRTSVSSRIKGHAYHFILLTGYNSNNFLFHDVGINNPTADQEISNSLLLKSWSEKGTDMDTLIIWK